MIDSDHNQAELLQELEQFRQRVSNLELELAKCQPQQLGYESELKQNTELRELLISLALDFISFPNTEIDSRINKLLKQIGEFIGADRSYINIFSSNLETLTRAHEWCAEGLESRIDIVQNIPIEPYAWMMEHYQRAEGFYVHSLDDFPEESMEKKQWQRAGAKSGIHLPLYYHGKLIGDLGFATVYAEKRWSEETIKLMKIAAQIYINALEHRESEQRLEENRKRFNSLIDAVPVRIVVLDEFGIYHEVLQNQYGRNIPVDIVPGDNIYEHYPKGFADFCMEKVHETLQKQEKVTFEYEPVFDGKSFSVVGLTVPYRDPISNQSLVIWVTRDNSQQRNAERALRESEKRLRSLLESLPDRAVVLDGEGTYHEVIRKSVWETDFSANPGENIRNLATKAFADFCISKVNETLQLQKTLVFEYEYEDSRQKRFLEGRTVPYKDPVTEQPLVLWILRNVTQERVTERNLRESEARYRTLIEQMPALVYRSSLENPHETNYVSPFIQLLLGYNQEEWLASIHNWPDHIHPDDRERIITEKRMSFPFIAEYRMLNRQNQLIWVRDESLIVRDANGQGLFIQGVVIDITQQKHFENALRESEQSYRAVFNSSTVLLTIHDGETLLLANQATAEILAYDDVTDLIGLPLKDFIHPDDQSFVMKIAKLRRQGVQVPQRYQMRIVDKQGGVHCVDSHSQTIEFAGNKVTLASAVDITEQKRFEQILRESEANYRAIVQDQTDLICRFTPEYTLTFINDAFEQYFASPGKNLIGSRIWEIENREEDDREALKVEGISLLMKLTPDTPVTLVQSNHFTATGDEHTIQWTFRALFDYKGKLVGYQAVGRDVTELEELVKARTAQLQHEIQEHEQTQQSLRQSLEQLDAANKELEAFSYTVSHDLRAPLRALNNYSQFLQEDCATILSEECLQYTEGIAESAQQMEKLVGDLLDYSRINRIEVQSGDVDIAELIDEVVMSLQLDQQATLHLPDKLPIIHAKRLRLEQIFSNLLSNALKFRQKGLPLEISIAFEERQDDWLFSVRDNGIGIDAKYQAKIFGIFQRLHTQEEYEGTGIGLAIVDKAVKEHNGQVVVESELGKGSKFSFTIARNLS